MKETVKGKLLILPPRFETHPNHTPLNQMRLRKWTPIVISAEKPKDGDLVLGSKGDGYPIIIFKVDNPYPGKKILALWDHMSDRALSKIEKGELQGNVLLLAKLGRPFRDEKGYVTFMQLTTQKLC